jgi:FPC/CPF motif-containing protein YcgG
MSVATLQSWTDRVLAGGKLGAAPNETWKIVAYEHYRAKLCATDYPCFFGQGSESRGEMLYTFIADSRVEELATNMRRFVSLIATARYERCSLVAFFEPDRTMSDHASFVTHFWEVLQQLHEQDSDPATDMLPDHPLWEFSFERCEMFVVGASPTYRVRRSRNLGPGMVLIFQPRSLFIDPATSKPIAVEVRRRIHSRMLAYDGMAVHPDIGFYGDPINREWKQYALPDDNEPEIGTCPFHVRAAAAI